MYRVLKVLQSAQIEATPGWRRPQGLRHLNQSDVLAATGRDDFAALFQETISLPLVSGYKEFRRKVTSRASNCKLPATKWDAKNTGRGTCI